jgi:hypothetical protein
MTGGRARRRSKRERRAAKFVEHFHSPGFVYYTHQQLCVVPGCPARDIDAAHERSRRAGGTWRDVFPCCHGHHMEQETGGIRTFERRYRIDLKASAAAHAARWEAMSDVERADWETAAEEAGYRWPTAA